MEIDDPEREAAAARLIAHGKLTREDPGQFIASHVSPADNKSIPDYDPAAVRKVLPNILEMNFDEREDGCFVILQDGSTGEVVTIALGSKLPKDTEELIQVIHTHYRGELDTEALDKTASLFDALEQENPE